MGKMSQVLLERVERGAARLDVMCPDWASRVTPETLNVGNCLACVLGQLFEHYMDGLDEVFPGSVDYDAMKSDAREHGFVLSADECAVIGEELDVDWVRNRDAVYVELTRLWVDAITNRLNVTVTGHSELVGAGAK